MVVWFVLLPGAVGRDFPGIEYLGELPHFPASGGQKRLGLARARWTPDQRFVLEGKDEREKPWRISLPELAGLGWTKVWAADFDANGFRDLLVIHFTPGNGRCPFHGSLLFVLFDGQRRPVVWKAESQLPKPNGALGGVLVLDANEDRKAEVVLYGCEYGDALGAPGDKDFIWSIHYVDGVFAAEDARWTPLSKAAVATHDRLARQRSGIEFGDGVVWKKPPSEGWPSPFEGMDRGDAQHLVWYRTPLYGCQSFLPQPPEAKPGQGLMPAIVLQESSPCDAVSEASIRLGGGADVQEIPDVVMDTESGREIHIGDPSFRMFWRAFRNESAVRLVGSTEKPEWLWIKSPAATSNPPLSGRLVDVRVRRSVPEEQTIRLRGYAGRLGNLYLDEEGCREVQVRVDPERDTSRFERPSDCPRLVAIRKNFGGRGRLLQVESELWLVDPETATLRRLHNDGSEIDTVRFRRRSGGSGKLISAATMGDLWIAQWADARESSLTVHDRDGEAITGGFAAPVAGELLRVTPEEGFLFVRWRDGHPIETVRVQASIQIAPAVNR